MLKNYVLTTDGGRPPASSSGAAPGRGPGGPGRAVLKDLPGLRPGLAVPVAAGLVATVSVVAQAIALAHLLSSAMPGAQPGDRLRWFAVLGTGVAGRALAALVGEVAGTLASSRAKALLRARLVIAALSRAPSHWAPSSAPPSRPRPAAASVPGLPAGPAGPGVRAAPGPGELAALAGRGLDALDVYIGRCLPDMVLAALAPATLLAAVGVLDWPSALVLLVIVGLFPVFGALVGRTSLSLAAQRWGQVERLGRQVADLFQGLPVLRAFACTEAQRARVAAINETLRRSSSRALRVAFLSALVLDTLGSVGVAMVAVPLGLRLLNGSVSLPGALAVLVIAPEVFLPLRRASAEFHESTEGLAAANQALSVARLTAGDTPVPSTARVGAGPGRVTGATSAAPVTGGQRPPDPRAHPVELRSVTVALPGSELPLLDGASLTVHPGETVVLVGRSGCGKSTVISLLLGFTTPTAGTVAVGGTGLAAMDGAQWRRLLTYLPEHPTLLEGTLADNLRLAEPGASDPELRQALRAAGADGLLEELPLGLSTELGAGGRSLSAGELQRVAIARALLRRRSLYLLDEPTVHLDQAAEARVVEALGEALRGRSALIVSHRPQVQSIADRVVALESGSFVAISVRGARPARPLAVVVP